MTNKWIAILGTAAAVWMLSGCSGSDSGSGKTPDLLGSGPTVAQETASPPPADSPAGIEPEETTDDESGNESGEELADPTITALVNKQQHLDETYVPADLVDVDVPTVLNNPEVNQLRQAAADALKDMFAKAQEAGIKLYARSGYRSYHTQLQLFNNYSVKHGEEAANRYSARAGQSEHQTGLAMDVTSDSVKLELQEKFGETEEGKWLSEHAHEFGFIIRYPKDMESVTGYIYEPWHIRYLGIELATKVYQSGLTYEEYLDEENKETSHHENQ